MTAQILQIPPGEYHDTEAASNSGLTTLLDCPAKFKAGLDGQADEQTEAMLIGSAFHCLALEPDQFGSRYHIMENSGNSSAAKKEKADALEAGKEILTRAQYEKVSVLIPGLRSHKTISLFLDHPLARKEISIFWEEELDGVVIPCKARPDLVVTSRQGALILDLKSINSANPATLPKTIYDRGYHRQAWWYMRALVKAELNPSGFYLGMVEKTPPYLPALVQIDNNAIEQGGRECLRAMGIYVDCVRSGSWPGYSEKVITIDLPDWIYRKEQNNETHGQFAE